MSQRRTVADLKQNVSGLLTGADLDLVLDFYGATERAAAVTVQKADIPDTMVRQPIMLYSGVTDYTPDDNIFGSAIIDIRRQGVNANYLHNVQKTFIVDFDGSVNRVPFGYLVAFEYRSGNPIMRISQGVTVPQVNLDPMTSTDGWSVGGDANTLLPDYTVYYQQPAALRFNLAAGGSQGTLEKTFANSIDITNYQGVGVAFLAAYFPDASAITSVTLQLGSDSSNYYEVTVTEGFLGAFYSNDYQLLAFDLAGATAVGSPDIAAMQWVNVLTNYGDGGTTLGPELMVNGSFDGNADGWRVYNGNVDSGPLPLDGWAYGSNNAVHSLSFGPGLGQNIGLLAHTDYQVQFTVGGSSGSVNFSMNESTVAGPFTPGTIVNQIISSAGYDGDFDGLFIFAPTSDFDGTISAVSVKQLVPTTVAQNNIRYGDLWISLPSPNEVLMYSAAAFSADGGLTWSINITSDDDQIIFRDAAYNIFLYETARAVAQNQGAGLASDTIAGFDLVLNGNSASLGLYPAYRGDNPSEELRQIGSYYPGISDGPGYGGQSIAD